MSAEQVGLLLEEPGIATLQVQGPHGQVIEEGPSLLDALRRIRETLGVIEHHLADHAREVPAGEAVVADVGHALRRQVPGGDLEDLLPDLGRHPREDPVADDVIEPAELVPHVHDAHGPQLDIGQPQRRMASCPSATCARTDRPLRTESREAWRPWG